MTKTTRVAMTWVALFAVGFCCMVAADGAAYASRGADETDHPPASLLPAADVADKPVQAPVPPETRAEPAESSAPQPAWMPPPSPGPSSWCQMHPQDCHSRGPSDPPVRTPREHCVDRMGNGDGYASMWEFQTFQSNCR